MNNTRQISPFPFAVSVTLLCLMHQFLPSGKADAVSAELWMDSNHINSTEAQTEGEFRYTSLRIQTACSHVPKIIQ